MEECDRSSQISMQEIKIAVIGNKKGIEDVYRAIKYPQLVDASYVYDDFLVLTAPRNFLDGYEIIIVAFELESLKGKIWNILSWNYGDSAMLIDFYRLREDYTPIMRADIEMKRPNLDYYMGVILGISHAEVGIISGRLGNGKFANLAVSAQDIYYNYKSLEYCYLNYPDKLVNLQTAIIDMFDYSYFDYDCSFSESMIKYLSSGGIDFDEHNFNKNKHLEKYNYSELVKLVYDGWHSRESDEIKNVWEKLFYLSIDKLYGEDFFPIHNQFYRFEVVSDDDIEKFRLGRYVKTKFENTLNDNIEYFEKTLELLYGINPDMKVYLTIIPRFSGVWAKEEEMIELWKNYFYSVLDRAREKYEFKLLDYSRDDIAQNRGYYYDSSHFNFLGALKFTDMLNSEIDK